MNIYLPHPSYLQFLDCSRPTFHFCPNIMIELPQAKWNKFYNLLSNDLIFGLRTPCPCALRKNFVRKHFSDVGPSPPPPASIWAGLIKICICVCICICICILICNLTLKSAQSQLERIPEKTPVEPVWSRFVFVFVFLFLFIFVFWI